MKQFQRWRSLLKVLGTSSLSLSMLVTPASLRADPGCCEKDDCCSSISRCDWWIAAGLLVLGGAAGAAAGASQHGSDGHRGPKGFSGEEPPGPQGPKGPTGITGVTGPGGNTGAQGHTGATGATGPQGPTGVTGIPGINGSQDGVFQIGPDLIRFEFNTGTAPTGATGPSFVRGFVVGPNEQTFVTDQLKVASQSETIEFGGQFDPPSYIGHYTYGFIVDEINGSSALGVTGAFPDGLGQVEITTNINPDNIEVEAPTAVYTVGQQVIFEFTYTPVTTIAPNGVPTPGNNP